MKVFAATNSKVVGLFVSVLALTAATFRPAESTAAAAELTTTITRLGAPAMECPTQCSWCFGGQNHDNTSHANSTNQGTVHSCAFTEAGCQDHTCASLSESSAGVVDLTRTGTLLREVSGEQLRTLANVNGRLRINWDRRAVQIIGCGEQVALSVNLSPSQLSELGATE